MSRIEHRDVPQGDTVQTVPLVKPFLSVGFAQRFLVPAWIIGFGFLLLTAPPLGALASLAVFTGGVIVVPMVLLAGGSSWRPWTR